MLPTFMRKARIFAFCRSLCIPLVRLYGDFWESRCNHIFRLHHNGQVCYLRHALNSEFGLTSGFDIVDADSYDGEWLHAKDSVMQDQLYATDEAAEDSNVPLLADEAQLTYVPNSFIVRVPADIYMTRLTKVKSIVEQNRMLTKRPIYISSSSNEQSIVSGDGDRQRGQWPLPLEHSRAELYTRADKGTASPYTNSGKKLYIG